MKTKLAMFDMDGTLFDTREVNYLAYKKALSQVGVELDREYFLTVCYGGHYRDFLKPLTTEIDRVHELKKAYYAEFLPTARENTQLFSLMDTIRSEYSLALVTTASRKNTLELLRCFGREAAFDLIVTQENVKRSKPDPEPYIYTMEQLGVSPENSIIFEDSATGIAAAEASGAGLFIVRGYA